MKKKIFMIILMLFIVLGLSACTNKKSDAYKFKEEYESLNGETREKDGKTIRTIEVDKKNTIKYKTDSKIVDMINDKKSFVVYFGFNDCPWCRSVVPSMIEAGMVTKTKIYYVDVKEIRDVMTLNEEGKLITETKGTDAYYELTNLLKDVLEDYNLNIDGKKIETGEKRIYAPNVILVKDGKAIKCISGISDKLTDPYMELTDEMKAYSYKEFKNLFNEL